LKKSLEKIFIAIQKPSSSILRQIGVIILATLVASVILFLSGYNPLDVYSTLVKGAAADLSGTIRWTIPMILSGLAIAVAFRSGVWNLGVDGQLYMGAIATTWICLTFPNLPTPISLIVAIIGGMLAGAFYAFIPGLLKALWGVNEVVTTLLFNFIALLYTDYLVLGPMKGTGISAGTYGTNRITENFYLARLSQGSQANTGIFIAIILGIILAILLFRTTIGYEFRMVGKNILFSKYGGINVKKTALASMCLSGAIAGLVGVVEILGVHRRFPARFASNLGFDGIVVSLLAGNHPVGILLSGLFFGGLRNGAMSMERLTEIPRAMVDIVNAIIVLMVSAHFVFTIVKKRKKDRYDKPSSIKDSENATVEV
jgi:simple sugar transport system permease protein